MTDYFELIGFEFQTLAQTLFQVDDGLVLR